MPLLTSIPVLPIVLHLFGHTVFYELSPPLAAYVWLYEKLIPSVYRDRPFVALSESTAQDLRRRGVRATRMDIVPPGLDVRRYAGSTDAPKRDPLLVYVGRLKRYKGLDTVLHAFVRLRQAVPNARLVLVGKGDDRPRLERLVASLRLADAVTFAGYVTEEEKIAWLHRARAVLYPSPREGWGISTIEAAASGAPVVASDAEGLRDAVQDGETGFLVPHTDVAAWAGRMEDLLTNATLHERLAAASLKWAAGFDWERAAEAMLTIVEDVALQRQRRAA